MIKYLFYLIKKFIIIVLIKERSYSILIQEERRGNVIKVTII